MSRFLLIDGEIFYYQTFLKTVGVLQERPDKKRLDEDCNIIVLPTCKLRQIESKRARNSMRPRFFCNLCGP